METSRGSAGIQTRSIAQLLLVATLFVAPLAFGAVQTWAWVSLTLLAALCLLIWGISCVQQGILRIRWTPLYLPGIFFFLLGTIQLFGHMSLDPTATREALFKLATDLIFFFLAGQLLAASSGSTQSWFGLSVTGYAFALGLFAILQFLAGNGLVFWTVNAQGNGFFGPYINRDDYAGLMEMIIPLAGAHLLSQDDSSRLRPLFGFAVLVAIASALLTGSRGGFISLLAEIIILGAVMLWRSPLSRKKTLVTAGTLGLVAATIFFFWIDPGQASSRFESVFHVQKWSTEQSFTSRLTTARDSLGIFRNNPVIGAGLGSFETAFPRYQTLPSDLIWDHAHNDYAEALAESGIVGMGLILWALATFFFLSFRDLGQRLKSQGGWIQLGAALGVCGMLIHSFVDFNLRIPANALWFVVCVAIGSAVFPSFKPVRVQTGGARVV